MIDGIKILNLSVNVEELLRNSLLTFPLSNISTEGELLNNSQVAEYQAMHFIVKNNNVKLYGSIHKYKNKGLHNWDDFYFSDLGNSIYDLCLKFNICSDKSELNGIEFGVNVKTPIDPVQFINSVISYKGTPFEKMAITGDGYGRECIKDNFIIKIYNKSLQYKLIDNILRFEIKVIKMRYFRDNGIDLNTLSDLKKIQKIEPLCNLLADCFNNLLVYDLSTDISNLNEQLRTIILQGSNPNYWIERKRNNTDSTKRKAYHRELDKFKDLSESIGATKYKDEIANLIKGKCKELINVPNSPDNYLITAKQECPKFTDIIESEIIDNCPKFTFKINCENGTLGQNEKTGRFCQITKLDISMQKPGSIFIAPNGMKYYRKNNPEIFKEVLESKLKRSKFKNAPIEIQNIEVPHLVRNDANNVYWNYLRDNKKRGGDQSKLFDDSLYFSQKLKNAIACRNKKGDNLSGLSNIV